MSEVRLNKKKNQLIELKEGESFCSKCNGHGLILRPKTKRYTLPLTAAKYLTCDKCLGAGKLDWVEKATGKIYHMVEGCDSSA
ncbi:MAG: hypothetical protein ACFFG0_00250 [Candidatus Thorarchaeota archaeon]